LDQTAALSKQERKRLEEMSLYESRVREKGFRFIAGVDEAGRGPLAGPVVAAACILPEGFLLENLNDSKLLTPALREKLYHQLIDNPQVQYGIGIVDPKTIDEINILQASFKAMLIAVENLPQRPDYLLIDGKQIPNQAIPAEGIIKGDSLSQSIAAASILAKYTRDQIMDENHKRWPNYGFASHKGYATKAHIDAIKAHGPCPVHRLSFEPVKTFILKHKALPVSK